MVTKHGRASPLIWKTIDDRKLRNRRNRYEQQLLRKLKSIIPKKVKATVLADRGFCNTDFFQFSTGELGWDFVIRIKKNIYVECVVG
ncbi:transposase [Fibrobacterota bacterium]